LLAPVNSPAQIGYVMKEAQMETAVSSVGRAVG
jgi:hypothetical protein